MPTATTHETPRRRTARVPFVGIAGVIAFLASLVLVGWIGLGRLEREVRNNVGESLDALARTAQLALRGLPRPAGATAETLIDDPGFARALTVGRQGDSGEVYAFDRAGRLLSRSRFPAHLVAAGLVAAGEDERLRVYVRDPGADLLAGEAAVAPPDALPLTRAASEATRGRSGVDVVGYRDYRGQRVLGAWVWDDALELGIAAEIDEAEAMNAYAGYRTIALVVFVLVGLLSLVLVGWVVLTGRRATEGLRRARDEWEVVAKTRSADLRASEERLQLATRAAELGIFVWDVASDTLTWDATMHRMYGVTPEAFGGRNDEWAARVHPDDVARVEAAIGAVGRERPFDAEYRIVRPDGEVRHIKANGVMQLDEHGRPLRLVGTNWDITSVRESEVALRRAKEAAEAATRAKSLFLANMSHEIRTPMNAVLGYAQLLLRDPGLDERQRRMLEIVHSSGDHLLTIINDILEMSKIEAGRAQVVSDAFDLRSLLEDVELMFRPLTSARGIVLTFALQEGLACELESDAAKVRQVVLNLLSNATKFTLTGAISVRASSRALEQGHHLVTLEVEDTGVGIEARQLATIFEAFAQTESGMRAGGTGLGLAISRSFARMLGGDITVESHEGRGSCFSFSFVAREAESSVVARRRQPMPLGLATADRGCKVLIVDDIATNRELMEDLLVRMGFDTRMATTGEDAIALHDEWQPAIILMDLRMPGMGGLEAMRRLRAAGSKAVLMAVTASGIVETEAEALAMGADGFLRKPYREGDLLAKIGELVGVSYELPRPVEAVAPLPAEGGSGALARSLTVLPAELVAKLRDAASEARAQRIEDLAVSVGAISPAAAEEIRMLVSLYRYDELLSALRDNAG